MALNEAREIVREEKNKIAASLSAIAGSRWLLAILATFALAFGAHLAYAPARLPPVAGVDIASLGLPVGVDFGIVGEQAGAAREAAERENVKGQVEARLAEEAAANDDLIPLINAIGFGAALLLLLGNMWIMTKRRRVTRG